MEIASRPAGHMAQLWRECAAPHLIPRLCDETVPGLSSTPIIGDSLPKWCAFSPELKLGRARAAPIAYHAISMSTWPLEDWPLAGRFAVAPRARAA